MTLVLLEATLEDYSPRITVQNPFKPTQKRWLPAIIPAKTATDRKPVGKVQLIRQTLSDSTSGSGHTYWLRFEGVSIRNDRDLPLYVLLSRVNDAELDDERSAQQLETRAQPVLLDIGPEGQWKGSHLPPIFEQEVVVFDPMAFSSIAIGKPAAAKPPTAQMLVFAYGAFQTYVPPAKSPEQIALEMEALSTRLLQTVMEMEQDQLQSDDELSLDALQRNAQQLFRMFDQDRSDSIDFEEYKQMLAYRKLNLLESKAKRFFELVDDQKKGYIDEREFVIAMYITNYLRKQKQPITMGFDPAQTLSPTDVFHQLDGDRDELLNTFEYDKALELLGVPLATKRAREKARTKFPKSSSVISVEQFKRAWVELVDVRSELQKRKVKGFTGMIAQKKGKRGVRQMQNALLDAINQEEQNELRAALQAKEEVIRLEKQHRDAEQEEARRLFQQQRHATTSMRTKEALRERQEKMDRKKERTIKDRQNREERRLLERVETEAEKRVIHERAVVQNLMATKMERIIRHRARGGDDIMNLRDRGLKELSHDLYHGRDAINSLSNLLILDLSRNRLQCLPGVIFTHLFSLQSLDISDNELEVLPNELGEARDLQIIDARNNRLTIEPSGLKNLHELRVLHLSCNRLVRFGDNCIGLRSLEELNLGSNAIETLADGIGDALINLVRLNLRGNPTLKRLPNSLQRLHSLVIWDLCECNQKRLGKDVFGGQLKSLRTLNLSYNALTSIPEGIGTLAQLQELNLKANALTTLPPSMNDLTELVVLNGDNNVLQWLPADCGEKWGSLEMLRLSHNCLTNLPPTLGMLRSLRTLQLANNRITALPLEFGALTHLRELDVSWNQLSSIPEELGCLESLTSLDISHNHFTAFPDTISMLYRLNRLRCSHNELTTPLEPGIAHLHSLRYVDFTQNQLTALEPCLYKLKELEVLNLSGNRITFLPREMFQHCGTLRKLDLYNNGLRALPLEMADGLFDQLEVLHIGRNPLTRLPDKLSSNWQLKDQYQTSFAQGYTSTEAKAWVADQRLCYPVFVRVWEELLAEENVAKKSLAGEEEAKAGAVNVVATTSDEFCKRVKTAMATSVGGVNEELCPWQPRYERLARHYFFEFKHVGHTTVFEASAERQRGEKNIAAEKQMHQQRLERTSRAITECNEIRQRLENVYCADMDVLTPVFENAHSRRTAYDKQLLQRTRAEAHAINSSIKKQLNIYQQRHDEAKQLQCTSFADEMKRLARERLQVKQQQRGKSASRKIVAVTTSEGEEDIGSCEPERRE